MLPNNVKELQDIVCKSPKLAICGGGSKTALFVNKDDIPVVNITSIAGLVAYQPEEFTVTALGGTLLSDLIQVLSEHHQFLPFDPPLVEKGATIGGSIAAGLSGPGRYRYGGIRDFILAIQFVNGTSEIVRAGAKVVKNSAGFDIPKLMVGSLGQLGALTEVSIKVFPQPPAFATWTGFYHNLDEALNVLITLTHSPFEINAIELIPSVDNTKLQVRIGGNPSTFPRRFERLQKITGSGDISTGSEEENIWQIAREFQWCPPDCYLVKVPLTPKKVSLLDNQLDTYEVQRRYSVGANLALIAWQKPLVILDSLLSTFHLSGLVLLGSTNRVFLGKPLEKEFYQLIKRALDPHGRWVERQ